MHASVQMCKVLFGNSNKNKKKKEIVKDFNVLPTFLGCTYSQTIITTTSTTINTMTTTTRRKKRTKNTKTVSIVCTNT